jgi:diguanylate cyclase (GGDEF)-like protein
MGTLGGSNLREGLRTFFSREEQFHGANLPLARRFTLVGWLLATVTANAMLPFYPPTVELGSEGWLIPAAFSVVIAVWLYVLLKHGERIDFNVLIVSSYAGFGMIAVDQWLAGGLPAPYHELYPFMILGAAVVHPPRRFLPLMLVTCAVVMVPELGGAGPGQIGDLVAELVLWIGASLFVMAVMFNLRQHREELQADTAEAQELARIDALTGLGNRRAFEEAVSVELSRHERSKAPLSLLICDLDRFKTINDRYGHLAGDDCLRQVAETMRDELRMGDNAFRWGGDEFVVVLADTDTPAALGVSSRLERVVARTCSRPDGEPIHLTTGIAEVREGMTLQELLAAADLVLREHKEGLGQRSARSAI